MQAARTLAARPGEVEYDYDALGTDLLGNAETAANGPYRVSGHGCTYDAAFSFSSYWASGGGYTYDLASGAILYEEYHPFGTSSYRAADSGIEVSPKRYRYIGRERDEETGLDHMGARYYASWLGRWTAADPVGLGDGVNRYAYVRGNPVGLVDPGGMKAGEPDVQKREPVIDLLREGRKEGVGTPSNQSEDEAAVQAADTAAAFAEADERLYQQELSSAEADLETARHERWAAVGERFRAFFRGEFDRLRQLRGERRGLVQAVREARGERRELKAQRELRGHEAEWQSVILRSEEGGYGFATPVPGARREDVNLQEGTYTQPSLSRPNILEARAAGIEEAPGKVLHTHPISADSAQGGRRVGRGGLEPSDTDLGLVERSGGTEFLADPRGRVTEYGASGITREISPGLDEGQARQARRDDSTATVERARSRQRQAPGGFEAQVERATRVLEAIDRRALLRLQRGR